MQINKNREKLANKYYLWILGCQMNFSDSERIAGILRKLGYQPTDEERAADLIMAVTCSVRQTAEDRVYGAKKKWQKYKKKNSKLKIVLTGCMADREEVRGRLNEVVDIFLNINEMGRLGDVLNKKTTKQKNNKATPRPRYNKAIIADYLNLVPKLQSKFQAYVPISTGCDNFCAYCIVPYARGRERSRPESEILCEIKQLVEREYKEITLLGQNVNSFRVKDNIKNNKLQIDDPPAKPTRRAGCRLSIDDGTNDVVETQNFASSQNFTPGKSDFVKLLEKINAISGNFWIKFTSPHPKDMGDDLIRAIAELDKVCERVHLPVQGGDNDVLKRMNRRYTREQYLALIKKARKKIKNAAISTDIIVGFPGETRKQFLQSIDLFKKAKFDMAYIARFSPRPGTAAAKMKDNVSRDEKKRRDKELTEVLKKTAKENNKKYVGRVVDVLVCEEYRKQSGRKKGQRDYLGVTRTDKKVKFSGPNGLIGNFVRLKIEGAGEWGLGGEIVQEKIKRD